MKRPVVSLRGNFFPARRAIARFLVGWMLWQMVWQELPLPIGIRPMRQNWAARVLLADPAPVRLALVRHAPTMNGRVEGTLQQLNGENVTLNSSAVVTGDLWVPGTPTVRINGSPTYGGTQTGSGSSQPTGYTVTLNSAATLGHVVRHTDPVSMNSVPVPPASTGTRDVSVNTPGQNLGNFATLRDLTLNSNTGSFNIPPGTYRRFTANSGGGFIFGVVGATQPSAYNLEELTLNSNGRLQISGPVVLNVANRVTVNSGAALGGPTNANWVSLNVARYDVTVNSGGVVYGVVRAPSGTITINGRLEGSSTSDRLTINSSGQLKAGTSNQPPIVDAGPDQTIALPGSVSFNGTVTDDALPTGSSVSVSWTMISGPGTVAFSNPNAGSTTASFTAAGTYVLRLTASDSQLSRSDDVTITIIPPPPVNQPPSVSAGPNQTITLPSAASLSGGVNDDGLPSGILTVVWNKVSGPGTVTFANPNAASTTASFSVAGTYVLSLTASDSALSNSANITITADAANQAPTVSAGANQTITLPSAASLSGVVSDDGLPSGILTMVWSKLSGPGTVTFASPNAEVTSASFSVAGTYVLKLTANDSVLSSSADVTVTVNPANQAPTVSSGSDQTVTLPNTASLNGTASDDGLPVGSVLAITWSKVSGPGAVTFTNANAAATSASFSVAGTYVLRLTANDSALSNSADVTITVNPTNQAPIVSAGPDQTITLPSLATLNGMASDDGLPAGGMLTVSWTKVSGPGSVTFANASMAVTTASFSAAGNYVLRLAASDSVLSSNVDVAITVNPTGPTLPPDPVTVAPPLDRTVATSLAVATEFLYTGDNPIQTGVAPGTINPVRAAVLRGRVTGPEGGALPGVKVTLVNHAEYGSTVSRLDGMFDLAVNGGGFLKVNYEKDGFLPLQRQAYVPWQDYVWLPEVVMTPYDSQVTTIDLSSNLPVQVAQGSLVSDADGSRRATVLFPGATMATLELPNGTTQNLNTLHIRATEYTVGQGGPAAMPAPLPPQSAYTYAVDLSADEAIAVGAKRLSFSQPVIQYVENFLNFAVGTIVPAGYFDRDQGIWIPSNNGRVVQVLAVIDGLAVLDIDGSGIPATPEALTALGITGSERQQAAILYQPGQSLWRVPITHFSSWDYNWPYRPPLGAQPPKLSRPKSNSRDKLDRPCKGIGSIIECENQILGEVVSIAGTPLRLHYSSDRVPGRAPRLEIPISGDTVPPGVRRIDLEIKIAGRLFAQSFSNLPNQTYTFTWDTKDGYGRSVQGQQLVSIRLGYVYVGVFYQRPPLLDPSFASFPDSPISIARARQEITLWQEWQEQIGSLGLWDARAQHLGGWTVNLHHEYDPLGRILYLGDGQQRSPQTMNSAISAVAGNGNSENSGDGGPAAQAGINPAGVTMAPDGSLYVADISNRVRRIGPDGVITTVAGNGTFDCAGGECPDGGLEPGFTGDGGPAIQARISNPTTVVVHSDGSFYILEAARVRRVGRDGVITTIAGTGIPGYSGDGGPAVQAQVSGRSIALSQDGSLYLADSANQRIRRIVPNGVITTAAGDGTAGYSGDGGLATQAKFSNPISVCAAPDGSLYIADFFNSRVRRVGPDGIITTVAGNGSSANGGDGGPATAAGFAPYGITCGPDGSFYVADYLNNRIRHVSQEGIIATVAGNGSLGDGGDKGPATQASISPLGGFAYGPDGGLYFPNYSRIRRRAPVLPGFSAQAIVIPSENGTELYIFDGYGRHLRTMDALTGGVRYQFAFDSANLLAAIIDGDGNVTTIERDANGNATAIVGPYGQRTNLTMDPNNYLASISNPAGEAVSFNYSADGLLMTMADPRGNLHRFNYDSFGRLLRDEDPAGGFTSLNRVDTGSGYEVTRSTALSGATIYQVERLSTGGQQRVVTLPDGTQAVSSMGADGSHVVSQSDGTTESALEGSDPRWGMEAPLSKSHTIRTPAGLSATTTTTQAVNLADANNPLSLISLTSTVAINGRAFNSVFNASDRTFTQTSPLGRQSTTTVDALGRVLFSQVAGLHPVRFVYDNRGRLATSSQGTASELRTSTYTYNASGYLETVTDSLNRSVHFEYDAVGRVTRQTLPDARLIRYSYDASGNLSTITPPGRQDHSFSYTPVDLTSEYNPPNVGAGSNQTSYAYDPERQPTRITRPDGQTLDFGYDSAGRLNTLTLPTGPFLYGFHPTTGHLNTITAPDGGSLSFSYDGSLPTSTTWAGAVTGSVSHTYDNNFRVNTRRINGSNTVSFQYDNDSLLTRAGDLALTRDPQNGLLTGTAIGSTSDNRVHNGFGEPMAYSASFSGVPFYSVQYNRDAIGRLASKTETISGITDTFNYTYDTAGRLVQVQRNGLSAAAYTYDSNNNRLTRTTSAGIASYGYDGQDRLTGWSLAPDTWNLAYTANGELLSKTNGAQTTSYQYDVLGNLKQVTLPDGTQISYLTEGQNRRIGKKVNGVLVQGFLYEGQISPVAELDGNNTPVALFVYARRANVPDYIDKGGVSYRIVSDHLGSPRLIINTATGVIVQRIDYDEFGNVTSDTNPGFQPFGFAGGLYDPQTKLVRFGARDYDAEIGRWTAKDPIRFSGEETNLYGYVLNDPINSLDRSGLSLSPVHGIETFYKEITSGRSPLEALVASLGSMIYDFVGTQGTDPYSANSHAMSGLRSDGRFQTPNEAREGSVAHLANLQSFAHMAQCEGRRYTAALYRGFADHTIEDSQAAGHQYSNWEGGNSFGLPTWDHIVGDLSFHWGRSLNGPPK